MIVGQSLCGKPCIDSQIPFTGGSGLLLDEAFDLAGVKKSDLYITNVVKCHPPNNRKSFDFEIQNCTPYLVTELEWLNPTDVICLGKDAWQFFSATVTKPSQHDVDGRTIHFLYHPAYIRRTPKLERDKYVKKLSMIIAFALDNGEEPNRQSLAIEDTSAEERLSIGRCCWHCRYYRRSLPSHVVDGPIGSVCTVDQVNNLYELPDKLPQGCKYMSPTAIFRMAHECQPRWTIA